MRMKFCRQCCCIDQLSMLCFLGIFLGSTGIFITNHYLWHYPIVHYFPAGVALLFCFLWLLTVGAFFILGVASRVTQAVCYVAIYNSIVCVILYATTAVQLTPFPPVDGVLLRMDRFLHYDMVIIMHELTHYPWIKKYLCTAYNFIDLELLLLPIFLIICRQFDSVKQYFFMVLATTLIGFAMYYFWPTTAPASMLVSPYFFPEQINTGIKFDQLHHYIMPPLDTGGLISMPSFHMIWAILCQHSAKRMPVLWYALLPMNILVIISALFLGWHYLIDFFGSLLVIGLACGMAWCYQRCVETTV